MPFASEPQRKLMWLKYPELARAWTKKYGSKPEKPDPKVKYSQKPQK